MALPSHLRRNWSSFLADWSSCADYSQRAGVARFAIASTMRWADRTVRNARHGRPLFAPSARRPMPVQCDGADRHAERRPSDLRGRTGVSALREAPEIPGVDR